MTGSVFSTVGIHTNFNAQDVIDKIVNDVVLKQVKETTVFHKQ